MDKCPYCGAETRPGDNFCLNCGNRLLSASPSFQQAQSIGDATIPASSDSWSLASGLGASAPKASGGWADSSDRTVANTIAEPATLRDDSAAIVQTTMDKIENPAYFIVRNDKGEVLQEYPLEKPETVIGRAPTSDILLSKDKLTSRRHAVVRHENSDYVLSDERSANGTFVNGQQLEELAPRVLKDGDHVGIGEHELVFRASRAASVEDLPTIAVPPSAVVQEMTYHTREDELMTPASGDDFSTRSMNGDRAAAVDTQSPGVAVTSPPGATPGSATPSIASSVASTPADIAPAVNATPASSDTGITFNRLTSLIPPTVPDISQLMAALTTLDGQVSLLQEHLNVTQEAIRNHESDIAQAVNQLRSGVRRVSERMDSTIASVARSRDEGDWASLMQLMEDVMNNPRDIEYVTKLARKARELNKVFQIHQVVLNTLAECNSLLRGLIGDEKS